MILANLHPLGIIVGFKNKSNKSKKWKYTFATLKWQITIKFLKVVLQIDYRILTNIQSNKS
jgi:hypothetical protein